MKAIDNARAPRVSGRETNSPSNFFNKEATFSWHNIHISWKTVPYNPKLPEVYGLLVRAPCCPRSSVSPGCRCRCGKYAAGTRGACQPRAVFAHFRDGHQLTESDPEEEEATQAGAGTGRPPARGKLCCWTLHCLASHSAPLPLDKLLNANFDPLSCNASGWHHA